MTPETLARLIAASIAEHQSRGLVDDASGLRDVVIHGRVDLLSVAADALAAASLPRSRPGRRSWSAWFGGSVDARKRVRKREAARARLAQRLASDPSPADAAIARLHVREPGL